MDESKFIPRNMDDLSVVVDGAETLRVYQLHSGVEITVPHCVGQTVAVRNVPDQTPCGATVLERAWNAPLEALERIDPVRINDIVIDSENRRWRIASIARRERVGRVVLKTLLVDDSPIDDGWIDLVSPIYETDSVGQALRIDWNLDQARVPARIVPVPVSSHRQMTTIEQQRIEIVFLNDSVRVSSKQRVRLPDGTIYKPTDLFPVTGTNPCLRLVANKEEP